MSGATAFLALSRAHRSRQPVDLQVDIALRRIEAAVIDDARDVAPDCSLADHEQVCDLGIGMAGADELETGLAPLDSPRPPLQSSGAHGLAGFLGRVGFRHGAIS